MTVAQGKLKGLVLPSGVSVFKGVPYAAAPVGDLRWRAPLPPPQWSGVKPAVEFGPRPVQKSNLMYEFRSKKSSEDCLYLNIWAPAHDNQGLKPVYVFIHGGSFVRGDGSQPAYDGESMAKMGIVYVSINYRLGVFGFMAHPELSKESGHGSGNYGLLDQLAALKWIQENISAFGGDPRSVTIGGESVGAQSVSAHLASPMSNELFLRAIAESGSIIDIRPVINSLDESEKLGLAVAKAAKATTLSGLRSLPTAKLLKVASRGNPRRFIPTIDGYFLKEDPQVTFNKGNQSQVPLLVGWNTNEVPALAVFRLRRPTLDNFNNAVLRLHGKKAVKIAALYPAETPAELKVAGSEFISDYAINYASWNLADLHSRTADAPVYRYLFAHPHPGLSTDQLSKGGPLKVFAKRMINKIIKGSAFHAAEIEYALGNLTVQPNYAWTEEDFQVSAQLQGYFANFIRTGNPNGLDPSGVQLANWPTLAPGSDGRLLRIGKNSYTEVDQLRSRYLSLREIAAER